MTVPLVIVAALAIGAANGDNGSSGTSSGPLPALSFAPPATDDATTAACAKVQEQLPVSLIGLAPRVVRTQFAVGWGDPAIVLRCGVPRPKALRPGSSALFQNGGVLPGPFYDIVRDGDANVWTTIDRSAYISISVPAKYNSKPLPPLSRAIQKALPAVCNPGPTGGSLCDRRK